ncbi:flagellar protein FlgN [Arthrobacter glacialis]|uniref:Flagellar biosynthesis protein FlgN n=1 Tax=Arthrobacter glacialis TaxID=1664 RepID=A0A2S3ZX29_ARTGL|nr:flagellar protein FlgN [Arthrobacter glacialis]POH59399.1 flagellar biosynthesis protein FlgN [Arthrobacter glacialis]POH73835.1 flagellar biosynthesis protein FlgN [Arthrobacter glacialis]
MGPEELTTLLWRERELLELLVFKLEEEHLILTSGKTRWLDNATREVSHVVNRLRAATLERTAVAAEVALKWGLTDDAGLLDLADGAPAGPWQEILSDHHSAMMTTVEQIRGLRDTNLQFLRAGLRSAQDTAANLTTEAGTYDHRGHTSQDAVARILDQSV